jgi:hypothetical protein
MIAYADAVAMILLLTARSHFGTALLPGPWYGDIPRRQSRILRLCRRHKYTAPACTRQGRAPGTPVAGLQAAGGYDTVGRHVFRREPARASLRPGKQKKRLVASLQARRDAPPHSAGRRLGRAEGLVGFFVFLLRGKWVFSPVCSLMTANSPVSSRSI